VREGLALVLIKIGWFQSGNLNQRQRNGKTLRWRGKLIDFYQFFYAMYWEIKIPCYLSGCWFTHCPAEGSAGVYEAY